MEMKNNYIFISYCHEDLKQVQYFASELEKKFNVWYDTELRLSQDWLKVIASKIKNAGAFIFIVTKDSIKSDFCRNEIMAAYEAKKPISLIYFEDVELPEDIALITRRNQSHLHLKDIDDQIQFILQKFSDSSVFTPCRKLEFDSEKDEHKKYSLYKKSLLEKLNIFKLKGTVDYILFGIFALFLLFLIFLGIFKNVISLPYEYEIVVYFLIFGIGSYFIARIPNKDDDALPIVFAISFAFMGAGIYSVQHLDILWIKIVLFVLSSFSLIYYLIENYDLMTKRSLVMIFLTFVLILGAIISNIFLNYSYEMFVCHLAPISLIALGISESV